MKHLDQLKNMVIMAAADGSLSEHEIALLVDRCSELGLDEGDLESAISFALSEKASIRLPDAKEDQMQLLSDLVRMMGADGRLSEVEKRLFALAAAKMGISRSEINSVIDELVGKPKA